MKIRISDMKGIIKKLLLMSMNGILAYYVALHFTNQAFSELFLGLIFVISFLIGEILSPVLIIFVLLLQNLNILRQIIIEGTFISITSIENFVLPLAFLFIIPLIQLGITKNSRGLISAESLTLQSYNPISSLILYFSGISFSENYINGILSTLPFLYLIFELHFAENSIIAVALMIVGSIIYSYNKGFYSVIGIVPISISSYLLSMYFASQYIYYGVILSIAINVVDRVVETIKSGRENKEAYESKKNKLIEEIKQVSSILYSLKSEIDKNNKELTNLISVSINSMTTIQNKIGECKSIECLEEVENEINHQKRILTIEINNLLFDEIRNYNNFAEKLKIIGINLGEIEYPKEEIKLEDTLYFYRNLKEMLSSKLILASNLMNNFIDNLSKILGLPLDKINVIRTDTILNRLSEIDTQTIDSKINTCSTRALNILQLFEEQQEYDAIKRLADLSLQPLTLNKINTARTILEKINNVFLVEFSMLHNNINAIVKVYEMQEMENLLQIVDIGIQILQTPDMPYCEKIFKLYNYISELKEAVEIANNKDSLLQLSELVDTIMPQILKTGEIRLSDIGISERYANFIIALLQKKGFKAEQNGDVILVKLNPKELP